MQRTRDLEYELMRRMSPAKKLEILNVLIRQAYALKAAGVRAASPELSEDQVQERVREIFSRD